MQTLLAANKSIYLQITLRGVHYYLNIVLKEEGIAFLQFVEKLIFVLQNALSNGCSKDFWQQKEHCYKNTMTLHIEKIVLLLFSKLTQFCKKSCYTKTLQRISCTSIAHLCKENIAYSQHEIPQVEVNQNVSLHRISKLFLISCKALLLNSRKCKDFVQIINVYIC